MPHPVGGAMGVALCTAVKRGHTRFDIISLNIHKATSRWHLLGCCTLTSTADFCYLARHPTNCSTALPKVFSSDLPVCQYIRTHVGVKPGRSPCGLHKLWPTLVHVHIATEVL